MPSRRVIIDIADHERELDGDPHDRHALIGRVVALRRSDDRVDEVLADPRDAAREQPANEASDRQADGDARGSSTTRAGSHAGCT